MMKKKYVLRTIKVLSLLFSVLICLGIGQKYIFFRVDNYNDQVRMTGYYEEPENTIDVVLLGASEVYSDFSSPYEYKQYGFTSYPYSIGASPGSLMKSQIKEIFSTQNPKLIVVEINGFLYDDSDILYSEVSMRRYIERIPFSVNKLQTIFSMTPPEEWINYFFPVVTYHDNVKNVKSVLKLSKDTTDIQERGFSLLKGNLTCNKIEVSKFDKNIKNDFSVANIEPNAEACLIDFLNYCKNEEIDNVIFTRFPHIISTEDSYERYKRGNQAEKIIKSYGFDFINFERNSDLIGLDYENDFFNDDHMNIYGQQKFTKYLGNLLMNDYGITKSNLSDDVKKNWDTSVEYNDLFYEYCENKIEEGSDYWPYETSDLIQELDKLKASKQ